MRQTNAVAQGNVVDGEQSSSALYAFSHNQSGKFVVAQVPVKPATIVFKESGIQKPFPDKYTVQLDADHHILCSGPLIYCNHSCDPNCIARVQPDSVTFVAVRSIEKGEPITFDYNTTELDMAMPFNCICGSENCKKRIAGFKNLTREQQSQISTDLMSDYIREQAAVL